MNYLKFLREFNIKKGVMLSQELSKEENFNGKIISFISPWALLLLEEY